MNASFHASSAAADQARGATRASEAGSLPEPAALLEAAIEAICQKGCRQVHRDIERLASGELLPEAKGLDAPQREQLLAELRAIMAVYGERCGLD
jgi:hypothetical protein